MQPTPLITLHAQQLRHIPLRLLVKRDDLNHPYISGNKWRKLKHNLLQARRQNRTHLLTLGGAYSNHLAAVAAAGKEYGFLTTGIVRGERTEPLNPTLSFASNCGMQFLFTSRGSYATSPPAEWTRLAGLDPDRTFFIPEGGSNCLALPGLAELVLELNVQMEQAPYFLCTACGTGGTLAGIAAALPLHCRALGIPVLKADFMEGAVRELLTACGQASPGNWQVVNGYHFGGYAKFKPGLIDFMNGFKREFGIPLDPVYTGKLFCAVFDLAEQGFFPPGANVVLLHSGGLQGLAGFRERFPGLLE
jgi:1-aminocyclopropane-1-carboxylate deaminase/D-cysteine desulfhydrase-like pyridoxal-dependent ACC family enzyme